jgi:Uncharacterised nucleotidyltransferase
VSTITTFRPDTLDRMVRAVEKVRERLLRSTAALESAGIPYAVIGGNAVAAWVSQVDEGAVRNTRDVDILVRRDDLPAVIRAMQTAGFEYANVTGVDLFIDGPTGKPSEGVHLLFCDEKVKPADEVPTPAITEAVAGEQYRFLTLEALVRMKLVSYRLKDRVHLQDLTRIGLIDDTWPARFPDLLANRLREILADPEG